MLYFPPVLGLDENMVTEIVEELSEEQKIAKEVTPLVLDTIKACFPQNEDDKDVDWDFVEEHFKIAPVAMQSKEGMVAKDGLEDIKEATLAGRNSDPNSIYSLGNFEMCIIENVDENSINVALSNETKTSYKVYNEYVQQDKWADKTLEEIHPEEVAIVTVNGSGYCWTDESHPASTTKFTFRLVKFDGTWYIDGISRDHKIN